MSKEVRALLPIWAGSIVLIAAASRIVPFWPTEGRIVFALSLIVLSAMSIGHEYVYGTLPGLLTTPASRGRLLANKLAALVPMLLSLTLLAYLVLPADARFEDNTSFPRLSLLFAVMAAPFFTMLCRGPIGGVAFAFGCAGGLQKLGDTGWHQGVLIAASAAFAISGWWMFMRLEVKESGNTSIDLPDWFRGPSHPAWLLVAKELRLQQITFVTAAAYLVVWVAVRLTWQGGNEARSILVVMGLVIGTMLAVLIGALAGAEERQMQTLEWQLLLPIAAWKQWTTKVFVTTVLSLTLAFMMPVVMAMGKMNFDPHLAVALMSLTVGSLYVATLCDTSIGATLIAAPVIFGVMAAGASWFAPPILGGVKSWPLEVAIALLFALLLQFGYRNYVSASHDRRRVAWQVGSMLVIVVVVGSMYYASQVRY